MPRSAVLALTLFALAALVAACADDPGEAPTDDAPADELDEPDRDDGDADATGETVQVTLEMGDMYYEPDVIEVPEGATVEFTLENAGAAEHDLVFEDEGESEMVMPGESTTFEAGPFTADTVGWCTVPGHRQSGMELEVQVGG